MEDTTQPIRSGDVRRQARRNEEELVSAKDSAERARRQVRQAALALEAQRAPRPQSSHPSGTGHVLWSNALPGGDGRRAGHAAVSQTTQTQRLLEGEELVGTGPLDLLRPGTIWAKTSGQKTETMDVRLEPARLSAYNEIIIPHVAGKVSVEVFGPQNVLERNNVEESRVIRLDEERRFNGRVRIQSQSKSARPNGDYIHALGGLTLQRSNWSPTHEVRAEVEAPADGQIASISASFRPSGRSPSYRLSKNGTSTSLPLSVSQGDLLRLRFPSVSGTTCPNLVRTEINYN